MALGIPAGWQRGAVGADAPPGAGLPMQGKRTAAGVPAGEPRVCPGGEGRRRSGVKRL